MVSGVVVVGAIGALGDSPSTDPEVLPTGEVTVVSSDSNEANLLASAASFVPTSAVTTQLQTITTVATTATKPITATATSAPAPAGNAEYNGRTVYITPSGEKYHYANPCGTGEYSPVTLGEAEARGLEPCEKCVMH